MKRRKKVKEAAVVPAAVVPTAAVVPAALGTRGSGGKNVIFSNCPYDQSKYSDPLIYISI
jgi:hypothetical protein